MFTTKLLKANISILVWLLMFWIVQTVHGEYSGSDFSKYINVEFCNDWEITKNLDFEIDARGRQEICYEVSNDWDDTTIYNVDFVYWKLDESWRSMNCSNWSTIKSWLAKYIETGMKENVLIKPKEKIRKSVFLDLKNEIRWFENACLVITQADREKVKWNVDVVMRGVYKISANIVWWVVFDMENKWNFILPEWFLLIEKQWPIHILQDKNRRVYVETPFLNEWNQNVHIEQSIKVTWKNYIYTSNQDTDLYPWQERSIKFALPNFPTFEWKFTFEISIKKTPIFQAGLEWISDEMRKTVVDEYLFDIRFVPVKIYSEIIVFSLIALIIVLIAWRIIIRRRKAKEQYTVWSNETLQAIAATFWCKWSQIACLNKIKAPYNIKKWDKLYVYNFKKVK